VAIEELIHVVPPPSNPIDSGSESRITEIENRLGVSLPKDILEFASRYGTGRFSDTLTIINPFSPGYFELINEVSTCYRDLKRDEGDECIPYEVYPSHPGLLVCGHEVNGHILFWLTEGEPDQWPLILMAVDFEFERLNVSLTTFLTHVFGGQRGCVLWDLEWVRNNLVGVRFIQASVLRY
jgi:SMI1 / KNR4 family (SUKH-1)